MASHEYVDHFELNPRFLERYYESTPELQEKLAMYEAMGERLIPPIRILRDWGFNITCPTKVNRFIGEHWPGIFPTFGTFVRIPGERTGEFLSLWEKDPGATIPLFPKEEQLIIAQGLSIEYYI